MRSSSGTCSAAVRALESRLDDGLDVLVHRLVEIQQDLLEAVLVAKERLFVGALLAATTGIVGAPVVAMGLISLPAMLRNNYSPSLASGTIAASGTLGQIIPPSIVLIILADQLASASDQASSLRKALHIVDARDPVRTVRGTGYSLDYDG